MKLRALLAASCLGALRGAADATIFRGGDDVDGPQGDSKRMLQLPSLIRSLSPGGGDVGEVLKHAEDLLMKAEKNPAGLGAIKKLIEPMLTDLMKQVSTSHNTSQTAINASAADIGKCRDGSASETGGPKAPEAKKQYDALLKQHTTCLQEQAPLIAMANSCSSNSGILNKIVGDRCAQINANPTHQADTCTFMHGIETPEDFYKRMSRYWTDKLTEFQTTKKDCAGGSQKLDDEKKKCKDNKKKVDEKKSSCDAVREGLALSACSYKQGLEQSCSTYTGCYSRSVLEYKHLMKTTQTQESVRKLQYRMVKRLQCLMGAFDSATNKVDKAKLDKCAATGKWPTDHLNITYPAVPPGQKCHSEMPEDMDKSLLKACTVKRSDSNKISG